jgi:excisionase family DNA binding protein
VETYLSVERLAKYLDIAEKTVRKWVFNHDIPYRKIHKVIRFRLSEIELWIDNEGKMPLLKDEVDSADGAARDFFPDDNNGAAVEVVASDVTVGTGARNDRHGKE